MVKKCNLQQVELRGNHLLLAQLQDFNWGRKTLVSSLLRAIPHLIPMIFGQFYICWGSNAFLWIADRVEGISAFRTRVMQVDDLGEEWSRCPRPTWDSREWSSVPISPKYTDASLCSTDAHIIFISMQFLNLNRFHCSSKKAHCKSQSHTHQQFLW